MSSKSATGVECRTGGNWTHGSRWVCTKHIWSEKRKFQLPAFFLLSKTKGLQIHMGHIIKKIRHTVKQMGQIVLKIGQNIAQLKILAILIVICPTLKMVAHSFQQFSLKINHSFTFFGKTFFFYKLDKTYWVGQNKNSTCLF